MDSVKIVIFDEEELTQTLVENYLKELIFPFKYEKYSEFAPELIDNEEENQIIILNINKYNLEYINEIELLSQRKNNYFVIISYDSSTDIQVKALKAGAKDFLIKPLMKSDFIYSLQQIYKNFIYKNNQKEQTKIFSVLSAAENDGKTTFTANISAEIANLSKENVVVIDIQNSNKTVAGKLNISNKYIPLFTEPLSKVENIPKYRNGSLYIFYCNLPDNISEKLLKDNIKTLKEKFKYIFFCIHNTENTDKKQILIELSNEIFYIISDNFGTVEKIKNDIKYLSKANRISIVQNKSNSKDGKKFNNLQTAIGQEPAYKIPMNYMAVEKSEINRITLNEVSADYDISQEYHGAAKNIINRI